MPRADERVKKTAARLSLATAAFLVLLKTVTGWLTGSISVWASLLDSAMDILASAINYVAVRASSIPPDEDHAYGHGKAESLAGLFQSLVIAVSGLFLVREGVRRLFDPPGTSYEWFGVGTMLVASAASAALVASVRRAARKTESPALVADAAHYATDIYSNGAALAALLVAVLTGWRLADPLISLGISAYILWTAVSVGRDAIDVLMDKRLPAEIDERVARVVSRFRDQGVVGFHDLRTRRSGSLKFIDIHLEVRREMNFEDAHGVAVRVMREIEEEIPRARVQTHVDPV